MEKEIVFAVTFWILITLASSLLAYGAYVIISNHISGTPSAQATLTLTASTTTPISGVEWTLTAHISDNSQGLMVVLSNNGVQIAEQNTDSNGNAAFVVAPTVAFDYVASVSHP